MKPRNKTERRVVELSATLSPLRQYDAERIDKDYRRVYKNKGLSYYLILERCKEFQVIRYYYKTRKSLFEFAQVWLNNDVKIVMAKNRMMGVDRWIRDSDMTIKDWYRRKYIEYTYLGGMERIGWSGYFIRSLLPELKKRGLRTSTHGISPIDLCCSLLHNNRVETLFKLGQYRLVHYLCVGHHKLDDDLWQAIRVALRHGYHWDNKQEISDWCDLIRDLKHLGYDIHNPHYICPTNLEETHLHYIEKRRMKEERERFERKLEETLAYEPTFYKNRERFMDFELKKGHVTIKIIPTAKAIVEEGSAMHHCVGGYYNRLNSLILSAKVDGKRMETIEVNLTNYTIVQSRGLLNKSTPYHNAIVSLMKKGLPEIEKRDKLYKQAV